MATEPNERSGPRLPQRRPEKDTGGRDAGPGWRVEGARERQPAPGPKSPMPSGPRRWLPLLVGLLVLLAINYWISSRALEPNPRVRIPYNPTFIGQVTSGNVKEISSEGSSLQGDFKAKVRYPPGNDGKDATRFSTEIPSFANTDQLSKLLQDNGVTINAQKPDTGPSLLTSLLLGFGPTILLVVLFVWLMRRAAAQAGGGLTSFGRSRARRAEASQMRVSFADVAGIDEALHELSEIVDFLKTPGKYQRLGGRIPRGVLLSGPPGTGKTLLARAVAGEADVPFFNMSASEFVEMIVGVGASRVRDLFRQAKEAAPSIIFIDELDAIGRARAAGNSGFGGNDEREQTLNQILTEMDGFESGDNVIVMGATNRPETLDPALLRPGRFDRRVAVQPPDREGRVKILAVHTRDKPLAPDVDLGAIASSTPGMVGADLANLANEAALLAASRGHVEIGRADFTDALEKIVLGAERKVMMGEADRRRTAYHEAGHAIVGMLTPGADPVRKVSIIPRGQALGVTFSSPDRDPFTYAEEYLLAKIRVALGGRVAEEMVLGDLTTGAESDIQQLTGIARQMVGRWGMSERIGPIAVIVRDGAGPLLPGVAETSQETQQIVDSEVRRIVDEAHEAVTRLLEEHRESLDSLAAALLKHETLDEADAYAAAGIKRRPASEEGPGEGTPPLPPAPPPAPVAPGA